MVIKLRVEILFYIKIVYGGGNFFDWIDKEVLNKIIIFF